MNLCGEENTEWDAWRFEVAPHGWWRNPNNQRRFLLYLCKQLGFEEGDFEKCYTVTRKQILQYKGMYFSPVYVPIVQLLTAEIRRSCRAAITQQFYSRNVYKRIP